MYVLYVYMYIFILHIYIYIYLLLYIYNTPTYFVYARKLWLETSPGISSSGFCSASPGRSSFTRYSLSASEILGFWAVLELPRSFQQPCKYGEEALKHKPSHASVKVQQKRRIPEQSRPQLQASGFLSLEFPYSSGV